MMIFVIIIHVIVCAGLICLVLIQRGRGSGLVESFSGVESMFGTKTDAFLTRSTTVMSIIFFITCLTLAVLSVNQTKSLIINTSTPSKKSSVPVQSPVAPAPKVEEKTPIVPVTVPKTNQ